MCSMGFCLTFFLIQSILLMHCREQTPTEVPKDGNLPGEREINVQVMKQFIVKFYKKSFVEDQNLVVAPLLIFKVFSSLYDIMDASAKYDLHSLAGIPQNANAGKMAEFETFANQSLKKAITKRSRMAARLYYDKSIGPITSVLKRKNFPTVSTNFAEKTVFLKKVNDWIKSELVRGTDDLAHGYDVDNKTKAFLASALSFDWPSHLQSTGEEKDFQSQKVQFLERSIRTAYVKLDHPKVEVVELKHSELSGIKLWLILPDKHSSPKKFKDNLTVEMIGQIEKALLKRLTDVTLSLPRVSIEYNSQEDAFVAEVFEVFSSLFTTPSVKLTEGKEELYPIKSFLMKCILRLNPSNTTMESISQSDAQVVAFDRPFVLMILTKKSSVPLMLGNYFSPKDKIRELEKLERKLHMDL